MPANPDATPEDAVEVISAMVKEYRELIGRGKIFGRPGVNMLTIALVGGLNAQTHALAEATIALWDSPTAWVATVPIARSIFECGLLAQWVVHDPAAMGSVIAECERQRESLAKQLDIAKLAGGEEIRKAHTGTRGSKENVARSVKSLTGQFAAEHELYAQYRYLCGFTHGGLSAADQWLVRTPPGSRVPLAFLSEKRPVKAYAIYVVLGLLYTASALGDVCQPSKNYANRLNQHAKRVGVDRRLILKESTRPSG